VAASSQEPYGPHNTGAGPEEALDDDTSTTTHTDTDATVRHWWKVQFDRRVFVKRVRIVHRDCCYDRIEGSDLVTIIDNGYNRTIETICANVGSLGAEGTFECGKEADEFKIIQPLGRIAMHLGEVYIYGFLQCTQ